MANRMFPVIHFEMPVEDRERATRFYEGAFGWQVTTLGPEMGDFSLVFTTATDEKSRMPRKAGAINGGFYKRTQPKDAVKLTILVDDIEQARERVKAAGGRFLPGGSGGEVDEMPDVGLFATFVDPEGNVVTIYEDRSPEPTAEQKALLES